MLTRPEEKNYRKPTTETAAILFFLPIYLVYCTSQSVSSFCVISYVAKLGKLIEMDDVSYLSEKTHKNQRRKKLLESKVKNKIPQLPVHSYRYVVLCAENEFRRDQKGDFSHSVVKAHQQLKFFSWNKFLCCLKNIFNQFVPKALLFFSNLLETEKASRKCLVFFLFITHTRISMYRFSLKLVLARSRVRCLSAFLR